MGGIPTARSKIAGSRCCVCRNLPAVSAAERRERPRALSAGSPRQYKCDRGNQPDREEHRVAQYYAYSLCVAGWALGASGESDKGLTQIAQGVESYGLGIAHRALVSLQADAQLVIGRPEAALASVAAGLKTVENMGGAPLEAELYRLKGKALLAGAGMVSEAEAVMQQGIDVARRQNAKSWELRAAMSLARLHRQQGWQSEARDLLAPIYGWFTEGFDTADLKEAKALLNRLTGPAIAAER